MWPPKTNLAYVFLCLLKLPPTNLEWSRVSFHGISLPSVYGSQFQISLGHSYGFELTPWRRVRQETCLNCRFLNSNLQPLSLSFSSRILIIRKSELLTKPPPHVKLEYYLIPEKVHPILRYLTRVKQIISFQYRSDPTLC